MLNLKKLFHPKYRVKEITTAAGNKITRNMVIFYDDKRKEVQEKERIENLRIINIIIDKFKLKDSIANELRNDVDFEKADLIKYFYLNNPKIDGKAFSKYESLEEWRILINLAKDSYINLNSEEVAILMNYYKTNGYDFAMTVSEYLKEEYYDIDIPQFKKLLYSLSKNTKKYGKRYTEYIIELNIINNRLKIRYYHEYISIDEFNSLYPEVLKELWDKKIECNFHSFFTVVSDKIGREQRV